ncbi:MAG: hypothetical protein IJP20_02130 [Clostridia bacterium]|nr:hypothetical protein [Clostridia bacterium]
MKKLLSLALVLVMMLALVACPPVQEDPLEYAEGTVLRMATGYNNAQTGLFFDAKLISSNDTKDGVEDGAITLHNGVSYREGDLKPTWVEVQNRLGIVIENKYQGNSAANEIAFWAEQFAEVDVVSGTASKLSEYGAAGEIVNLAEHLDKMPNFKAYLEANPIVRLSITGDTSNGAIYFSPYFDGVNDIERMPLMRTDWVEKLLNGEGDFTAEASKNLAAAVYEPYMPTSGKVAIEVVKADGSAKETIYKDYTSGNIIAIMNAALAAGDVTGVEAVNMLRDYIDTAYNGYYGTNRADLFIGQNAAWDADELVALLRCVVANPQTLNGTDTVQGLFSREDGNNQRRVDMFRFAGTLFGVRGLESRQDYLYVGNDGLLHDARQEEATYVALERMNAMTQEGLISKSFIEDDNSVKTDVMLSKDAGFMHYDYNQTQTVYNETKLNGKGEDKNDVGEKYMAVMVPVARWNDGTGETFMRFTESWRSVKTDGWGISVKGVGDDVNKLNAALKLIDYAYSKEGQILMSYGPDEFIKRNADGSYVMFDFNGEQWPVIADETFDELWTFANGNYTNFARQLLGSTLSFVKSQSFEYQCTTEVGKEGAGYISRAIALGTIRHPELAITENPWWTSVPTVLPTTKVQNDELKTLSALTGSGATGKFSSSKDEEGKVQTNLLVDIISVGYAGEGTSNRADMLNTVKDTWGGSRYLEIKNLAWEDLLDFYNK